MTMFIDGSLLTCVLRDELRMMSDGDVASQGVAVARCRSRKVLHGG